VCADKTGRCADETDKYPGKKSIKKDTREGAFLSLFNIRFVLCLIFIILRSSFVA
jgi:hypothetical protein